MPKVSVITPIHCDTSQKVDWLDEMIQSVINQSLVDFEIILINDKSPLPLDPVKMKYAAEARLRWFENAQNDGPAKTRNTAVALAETECILPLDADDMLADNEVLEYMYDAWLMDRTKIIYGNLQLYTQVTNNIFKRGRVVELGEYTFELAMNLGGIMPVTAMHSKDCHYQSGGWKAELKPGLEDVEYWIAAGERGFCGQKISHTTLVYRRQENSRAYKLKHVNQEFRAMQDKIKMMHSDIYRGVFPVACCNKEASNAASSPDPMVLSQQNQKINRITALEGYEEKDLEWVLYEGLKKGRFDVFIRGRNQNIPNGYTILGTGHCFQIHKEHKEMFVKWQNLGYRMNQPDPRQQPEPEPVMNQITPQPQVVEMPKPEMSTIVRPDSIAVNSDTTFELQEMVVPEIGFEDVTIPMPKPVMRTELVNDSMIPEAKPFLVSDLGLSDRLTQTLIDANFTFHDIVTATPQRLSSLPGIGIKRANAIIAKAQELITNE